LSHERVKLLLRWKSFELVVWASEITKPDIRSFWFSCKDESSSWEVIVTGFWMISNSRRVKRPKIVNMKEYLLILYRTAILRSAVL
jgi:hypothetical protein